MKRIGLMMFFSVAGIIFILIGLKNYKDKDREELGVKIYKYYKDAIVDIKVTAYFNDTKITTWGGSGTFIDKNGNILTAGHVAEVEDGTIKDCVFFLCDYKTVNRYEYWIYVTLKGRKYKAELVGINHNLDAAILRVKDIEQENYQVAKIGNSDKVQTGETVFALGMPFGLSNSISKGIVSAVDRKIKLDFIEAYFQVDAPINPGNSGGILVNKYGEVIGINVAGVRGADGIGFAVPINLVNINQLMKGRVGAIDLGFTAMLTNFLRVSPYNPILLADEDAEFLKKLTAIDDIKTLTTLANFTHPQNPELQSWAIVETINESVKSAGIKQGDVILSINKEKVKDGMDIRIISTFLKGGWVQIEYLRIDGYKKLKLKTSIFTKLPGEVGLLKK